MIIIEKSDAIGWFDAGFQTSAPGQAGCNIQIGNLASDWNDGGLPKGRVSLIVNDKCPYLHVIPFSAYSDTRRWKRILG